MFCIRLLASPHAGGGGASSVIVGSAKISTDNHLVIVSNAMPQG